MNPVIRRIDVIAPLVLGLLVILLPFQGIQWGDGLEFVAVSSHLGIAHPPGYPLFTILARLFLFLPTPEPYAAVLLMCRIVAWLAAVLVAMTVQRLLGEECPVALPWAGAAALLFCPLLADSLACIEVYTLQAALVSGASYSFLYMDGKRLAPFVGAGSCLGLALANHLPGLSLAPLLLLGVLKHHKRGGSAAAALVAVVIPALVLPLCLYGTLPLRVVAADGWGIAWGSPDGLASLATHVRGGEYGQYQLLQLAPGVPMTFAIWVQFAWMRCMDTLAAAADLVPFGGVAAMPIGIVVLALMLLGGRVAWQSQRSWVIGIAVAVGLQLAFISVYNIPDIRDYFVPLAVLVAPLLVLGLVKILRRPVVVGGLLAMVAIAALGSAFLTHDPKRELAELYRDRLLTALPEGASILTSGDADVYTMWYAQFADGERRDVAVVGANFIRFPWFQQTIRPDDPRRGAVTFEGGAPPRSLDAFIDQIAEAQVRPLLAHGRVFWSVSVPDEVHSMRRHFEVRPAFQLLADDDLVLIQSARLVNFPAPILFEIESR